MPLSKAGAKVLTKVKRWYPVPVAKWTYSPKDIVLNKSYLLTIRRAIRKFPLEDREITQFTKVTLERFYSTPADPTLVKLEMIWQKDLRWQDPSKPVPREFLPILKEFWCDSNLFSYISVNEVAVRWKNEKTISEFDREFKLRLISCDPELVKQDPIVETFKVNRWELL